MGERIHHDESYLPKDSVLLPELTENQADYVGYRLEGYGVVESWRLAYPNLVETHKNTSQWSSASRTEASGAVRVWIAESRKLGLERCVETYESHVGQCRRLREEALQARNYGAAVAAQALIGKASGFDKLTIDHNHKIDATEALAKLEAAGFGQMAAMFRERIEEPAHMKDITPE